MSKEDKPAPSPNHGLFDPAHLFGAPSLGLAATGLPFPHLAHLPAYPWLARPAFPPALFGGLGALPSPLLTHGLPHSSAADFGGADWWRAASEHAQRGDLFMTNLGPPLLPSLTTLSLESNTPGLEFLLTAPSEGDKSALFNMSKHLTEIPSTSTSTSSPSKRSRTPTPAPAHQKSSSKTSTSTSSSSSSKDLHLSYPPFTLDGKDAWHLNGSAFSLSALSSKSDASGSRKRRHKDDRSSSRESKVAKMKPGAMPAHSNSKAGSSRSEVRGEEVEENGVLNLSKSAPSATVTSPLPPPVTPGVEDLSMKKNDKSKAMTNGTTLPERMSPDPSSVGSDSDHSDGNLSDSEKGGDRIPAHHIDGSRKQLLADQIRQHILADTLPSSLSHQSTPLVIPSLRARQGKEDSENKKAAHMPSLSLVNFVHDYPRPDSLLLERDLLGLPSTSAALHTTSPHVAAALSFLPAELRPNHHSKEESQDSLLSLHTSEADDKHTSGSERLIDSESPSGWGSDDDASRNRASSSASPGPSCSEDPSKRRNIVLNEKELLIPLEHGWRRQTTIHGMGRRGIVGEVLYFAPCNKKMKTIPDVMRYLDRHAITDLSRENFTFNTKVNVGQFYEIRDMQVVRLTEVEIQERIAMSKGKRARMQMLAKKKCEKQLRQQALAKQLMEAKFKKRQEQQEMARKAAEMRYQMRLEKEQQKEMAKKAKQVRLIERQREKERSRIMKQQEKIRLQEQLRIEREMKAQQILEARRRRQVELEEMRLKEIARKNKEREMKKQQQIIEKEQEKERRRQHFLLVKALEQRKKEEERLERERQREEKIRKQNIEREKKLAQRQIEMLIAREMKKPMDDMELRNGKPLPKFPRCAEAKLPGPAFSDALMVVEFVHNFADALGLDSESLPSLEVFQNGLLNTNDEDVEEVVTLYLHLLRFALDDLGVPNPKSAMTALNQKITDLEITDATMSEVTRLFLFAHGEKEMSQWLEEIPLEALNATKKAAIMAFLVNELLSSKRLSGEIERTLEAINTLRRDKWIVEGKLRKLRTVRARKYLKLELMASTPQPVADDDSMTNTTNTSSKAVSDEEEEKEEEEEEKEEEEEMESFDDNSSTTGNRSEDEDEGLSKEEMEKKIEKLSKQHNSFDSKVADVSKQLRGTCLGQDRYKRFYWILPYAGGVFVEGIESGDTEALPFEAELLAKQKAKEEEEKLAEAASVKAEKTEGEGTQTVTEESDKAKEGAVGEEKDPAVKSILDQSVIVKDETCEKAKPDQGDSIPKEVTEGGVCVKSDKAVSSVMGDGDTIPAQKKASVNSDTLPAQQKGSVNSSTQENSMDVVLTTSTAVQAVVQDRGVTTEKITMPSLSDLVKKSGVPAPSSCHQEPILCKLNDLFRLPHLSGSQPKPEPSLQPQASGRLEDGAGKTAVTVASTAVVSSSSSSTSSLSLLSPSSSVSAPSAVTLTMSSLSSVLTVTTATTVSSTPSYPSPLLTLSSSSASSTLSSLAAAAATGSSEANPLGPLMASPTVAHSLSSTSTTILSSTPVSCPLSVSVAGATSTADGIPKMLPVSSVLSPLKASASKSLLTVSLLSPEFSTTMLTKPGGHSPSLTATPTSKPCLLSPPVRKTMSSTATTILSSTPLSMLAAMSKATTLSPSASSASVSAENGLLLQRSSTPVVSSSSLLSSSRTVSLLNSTPVTSPIPSVSSSPMKDKKSNFVSIDALLKKDPQSSPSPSSSTTASVSTSTPMSSSGNNNKHFLNPSLFPPSPLITDHQLKSYVDILDQKPWFSILPRIPCDEVSLTLPKVATSTSVPGLGLLSSDNIASASLSLLSLLPMQHQVLQEQKMTAASQSQTSPAHTQTESQTKSLVDFTSAFQAHLSQSSLEDISMTVSTATNTADLSICTDSFKVPAPPSESSYLSSEILLGFDPTAQLMKIQGERLPIPLNKQRGWWKIQDAQQVRQLYSSMLGRGIREKNLSYMLRKHMEFMCTQLCKVDTGKIIKQEKEEKPPTQLAIQEESSKPSEPSTTGSNMVTKATETDDPRFLVKQEIKTESEEVSETKEPSSTVKVEKEKGEEGEKEEEDGAIPKEAEDSWSMRVAFEVEMACLEDVEALEDRIFNASLQVKVWKLPQRASEDPDIRMVDRQVQDPQPPNFYPMDLARQRLLLLEGNIERRYLKPPLIRNVQLNLATLGTERSSESRSSEKLSSEGKAQEEEEEETPAASSRELPPLEMSADIPPGLMLWRRAVHTARTPAQLNLCTQLLGNSIAWEKSIMKVTCQICMKDDNEAELLLCDGCDKGYHTYCFKPKMDNIPDGDWYCYECVSKVSGKSHCIVCGGQGGKIVECERCPRAIHTDCLDPPLPRMPKKWQCAICIQTKSKKSCKRKRKEPPPPQLSPVPTSTRERKDSVTVATRDRKMSEATAEPPAPSPEKKKKETSKDKKEKPQKEEKKKEEKAKEEKKKVEKPKKKVEEKEKSEPKEKKPRDRKSKKKKEEEAALLDPTDKDPDMVLCAKLLLDLEKSDDGWPFLRPVSTKQFPSYRRYIRQPMDFTTMKHKLRNSLYKERGHVASDLKLIWTNCETFNEDDSEVGQAGHNLRRLFLQKWKELFPDDVL